MKKKDNFILFFPPVWLPDVPFLSTPALTAFLKQNDINVEQIDLNIHFWDYLNSISFIANLYSIICQKEKELSKKQNFSNNEIEILKKASIISKLSKEQFIQEVSNDIISKDVYLELVGLFSIFSSGDSLTKYNKQPDGFKNQDYHDLLYNKISFSQHSYSINELKSITCSSKNPYYYFYSEFVTEKLKAKEPAAIGISITANNQVIPAFTLAYFIRKHYEKCKIVIGGSWCTLVGDDLGKNIQLFPYIDYVIVNEGELPLLNLLNILFGSTDVTNIEGVYYKCNGTVRYKKSTVNTRLNNLPTPDFTGLPLERYYENGTLPIQSSRGCYWGKCIFCSYPVLEREFKQRDVSLVIRDIKILQKQHGTKVFSFIDSLISPSFAEKLSERLIAENIIIEWVILARLEKQFSKDLLAKMNKSGCTTICWGLESGNQKILNIIRKNIDLKIAEQILKDSNENNIHNRVLVMYGLPSETINEASDTITFIKNNIEHINSLSYNYYHPEKNTPIEEYSKLHDIILTNKLTQEFNFGYEWQSDMSDNELETIYKEYSQLENYIQSKDEVSSNTKRFIDLYLDNNTLKAEFYFKNYYFSMISYLIENNSKKKKRGFFEVKNL